MIWGHSKLLEWGEKHVSPFRAEHVQPASIDLRLFNQFIRVGDTVPFEAEVVELAPGDCLLAATLEVVTIPVEVRAKVEGKSSLGRRFIAVHVTAGFIDPGFGPARITLEIVNLSREPHRLSAGQRICQLELAEVVGAVPYTGKYQGDLGPQSAKEDQ